MSRFTCEICEDDQGFLTCPHVGSICFDCWGSGIHQTMVRKAKRWNVFLNHVFVEVFVTSLISSKKRRVFQ